MRLETQPCRRVPTSVALAAVVVASLGCSQVSSPVQETVPVASERRPVVFVPGVTGVGLRDESTQELVWGQGKNLIRPHDRGHGIARSLTASHPGPRLLPGGVILELKLFGFVRFKIYQELVDLFQANGYRLGDLEHPRPADDFFLFSYDWRQDNVSSAIRLADQLETLRRVRGQEALRIDLICQSNGAHVCRYFTKYGGLNLNDAESGDPRSHRESTVENLILVGASNGGSIRVLRELNRGRKYVDVIGRYWSPETLFTFASLFQDLPIYTTDLFVDENAQPLPVDLFDAESWQRFQWSIYGREANRMLGRDDRPVWLGTPTERREHLVNVLDRARRFHRLLSQKATGFGHTQYHLITSSGSATSSGAVLVQEKGRWKTLFADDKRVRRHPELRSAVVVAGDGHATAASQTWLSPQEIQRLDNSVLEVEGTHRRIILQEQTHQRILQIIAPPLPRGS